jgi:hypothetical protein
MPTTGRRALRQRGIGTSSRNASTRSPAAPPKAAPAARPPGFDKAIYRKRRKADLNKQHRAQVEHGLTR